MSTVTQKRANKTARFVTYEQQATLLRALGDPYRLQIIHRLRTSPQILGDIVTWLAEVNPRALAQPTVSHHMRVLLRAGLVSREKLSRCVQYSLVPGAVPGGADELPRPPQR